MEYNAKVQSEKISSNKHLVNVCKQLNMLKETLFQKQEQSFEIMPRFEDLHSYLQETLQQLMNTDKMVYYVVDDDKVFLYETDLDYIEPYMAMDDLAVDEQVTFVPISDLMDYVEK